jgi:hypothetical protein
MGHQTSALAVISEAAASATMVISGREAVPGSEKASRWWLD